MERGRPLLIPFVSLATGLVCADMTGFLLPQAALLAVLALLILSCFADSRPVFICCTASFFFCWGLYALTAWKSAQVQIDSIRHYTGEQPVIIEGVVDSRPAARLSGNTVAGSFELKVEAVVKDRTSFPANGRLLVHVAAGEAGVLRGDRVRFISRVMLPRLLGLPGEFDYPRFLALRGISATARVADQGDIVLIRGKAEDSLLRRADLLAARLGEFIRNSVKDERVSSVIAALLIGDQKRIPADLNSAYTRAGVTHILSISGFHVGIIALAMVQLALAVALRFESAALRFNLRRGVLLISLPVMVIYLLITGTAPATARAVIMLAVFVAAMYAERESDPFNVLLLSAMLLTVAMPTVIFDVSFQLSFIALWGISLFVPPLLERFRDSGSVWRRQLLQFALTSVAATAATAIPVLFWFNQASLNGILANFLIVPLLGYGAVLTGFAALLFAYMLPPLAELLLWMTAWAVQLSNRLIEWFAGLPVISFYGTTAVDMLILLAFMSVLTFFRPSANRTAIAVVLPLTALGLHLAPPKLPDGRLHVTMLSVGQAESVLIRLPGGATLLVDGGGYLHENGIDFGERYLAPALRKLGVKRIDWMVMTHDHPDHIGGLPYIASSFPVGEFIQSVAGGSGPTYDLLLERLLSQQSRVLNMKAGDILRLADNVTLRFHSPRPAGLAGRGGTESYPDQNEDSLVFTLQHGGQSVLFTADAGFVAEQRIMASGARLEADVLKVGHHGSRHSTSDPFLDRVKPRIALISAGSGNRFGLPAPETVRQLEKRGIRILRTDRHGTIELSGDGSAWSISTSFQEGQGS